MNPSTAASSESKDAKPSAAHADAAAPESRWCGGCKARTPSIRVEAKGSEKAHSAAALECSVCHRWQAWIRHPAEEASVPVKRAATKRIVPVERTWRRVLELFCDDELAEFIHQDQWLSAMRDRVANAISVKWAPDGTKYGIVTDIVTTDGCALPQVYKSLAIPPDWKATWTSRICEAVGMLCPCGVGLPMRTCATKRDPPAYFWACRSG